MYISNELLREKEKFIWGMFSLSGLSESGKSAAGLYFDSIGIKRMKIIQFEKEMMRDRGYDFTDHPSEEDFVRLYADDEENTFREWLYRLICKMEEENIHYASIESLYRAKLGSFLKREFGNKMLNVYIDAPFDIRVRREYQKQKQNNPNTTFEEIKKLDEQKDQFKIQHGALEVKDIADIIVNNGENVTSKEDYLNIMRGIASIIKK